MAALAGSVQYAPLALVALLLPISVYRRIRRNVGRQAFSPLRLKIRSAVMLAIVAILVGVLAHGGHVASIAAFGAGALAGIALSRLGVRLATLGEDAQGTFYRPNPWLGSTLSLILVARLAWRMFELWPALSQPGAILPPLTAPGPLTSLLLGAVLVYYVAFSLGVLRRSEAPRAAG